MGGSKTRPLGRPSFGTASVDKIFGSMIILHRQNYFEEKMNVIEASVKKDE
jgi:hypothetical protein